MTLDAKCSQYEAPSDRESRNLHVPTYLRAWLFRSERVVALLSCLLADAAGGVFSVAEDIRVGVRSSDSDGDIRRPDIELTI